MTDTLDVLYNASCPICRREVDHYAKLSARHDLPIGYHDLGEAELAAWGMTAKDAAQRLHVRKDGQIYGGIPAFIMLWREIPQMRWLARLASLPVLNWLAVKLYDHILAPLLYRWHLSRERKRQSASR
ncbi:MAG: DUF393 domain-containing protein [Sulfitobacter sp.]|nr:DUF393 domain-containing protein [Sulfitobacter sp.]MDG1353824.1 DUF393 domain-containing protein [Sulfitobacter sp.]